MKFLKYAIGVLSLLGLIEFTNTNQTEKKRTKKLGEKCKRRTFGSECIKGLECDKKKGVCLKIAQQKCTLDNECLSNKCFGGKCK